MGTEKAARALVEERLEGAATQLQAAAKSAPPSDVLAVGKLADRLLDDLHAGMGLCEHGAAILASGGGVGWIPGAPTLMCALDMAAFAGTHHLVEACCTCDAVAGVGDPLTGVHVPLGPVVVVALLCGPCLRRRRFAVRGRDREPAYDVDAANQQVVARLVDLVLDDLGKGAHA